MASFFNLSALRQNLTQSVMDGLTAQWNQLKTQVVTQIASNIIGAPVSVTQMQEQTQQLEAQYVDMTQIFQQAEQYHEKVFEMLSQGCLSKAKTLFGSSAAETLSWLTALGLGISASTAQETTGVNSDSMKALSVILFIAAQGISKFNDYHHYKNNEEVKKAQRAVVQARSILAQRQLLETTHRVTTRARALLAPSRDFSQAIPFENKAAEWRSLQASLKEMFEDPQDQEPAEEDSVLVLRSYSTREDLRHVESLV